MALNLCFNHVWLYRYIYMYIRDGDPVPRRKFPAKMNNEPYKGTSISFYLKGTFYLFLIKDEQWTLQRHLFAPIR